MGKQLELILITSLSIFMEFYYIWLHFFLDGAPEKYPKKFKDNPQDCFRMVYIEISWIRNILEHVGKNLGKYLASHGKKTPSLAKIEGL